VDEQTALLGGTLIDMDDEDDSQFPEEDAIDLKF